ncbi:hypothetical protein BMS3Bbin01_02774 [bacterium BMS3Bbin01]|nr:hypothetical protein BMS3Bbin01_02774 [bacterium BMS3Bbin01]
MISAAMSRSRMAENALPTLDRARFFAAKAITTNRTNVKK